MNLLPKKPYRRRRNWSLRKKKKFRLMGAAVAVAALLGLAVISPDFLDDGVKLDPVTLCPVNFPITEQVVLLVDRTDPFTEQGKGALKSLVLQERDKLSKYGRLSIHIITGNPETAERPVFNRCNPGDGSLVSRWIGNKKRASRRWKNSFSEPLDQALAILLKGGKAKYSYILESIEILGWDPAFGRQPPARRLVLITDGLENVPGHSHYRRILPVQKFLQTSVGRRLLAKDWRNMTVLFQYLRNPAAAHVQGVDHLAFWIGVFGAMGVRLEIMPPLKKQYALVR